ncbi:hypothetical protein FHU41_001643 [Psychromicrobium silvestre]|uniref:EamA-like transporter family n=1 Tax=Psychromicrobium silvestre TaxID=1645614 RepID=A0A7Y9LTJ9_9MICC|nr:EamA family transporter [Psychromicrobium silvestre]NYE95393.1 hypothetical protein [Psychromicrobium silvestre]
MVESARPGTRKPLVLLAYLALAATWGASFLFMKVGLEGLSSAQVVWGRLAFGALALVALMIFRQAALASRTADLGSYARRLHLFLRGALPALRLGRAVPALWDSPAS